MKYTDRVRAARDYAGLTQEQLAKAVGMSQPSLNYLEDVAHRSKFTASIARVCRVNPDWLADGIGEMVPNFFRVDDPRIAEALRIMESLPDYAVDEAIKSLAGIANLVDHNKPNGTVG